VILRPHQEARFADPWFAGDDKYAAVAFARRIDRGCQSLEFRVSPEEHRDMVRPDEALSRGKTSGCIAKIRVPDCLAGGPRRYGSIGSMSTGGLSRFKDPR
jgi:hypothetical protein